MRQVDIQALSVEEAVRLALEQLGRTRDQVKVEVLATDPNGDEVLVRVTAPDMPGKGANEEISPRRPREGGRPDRGDRGPRPGGYREQRRDGPPRGDRADRPPRPKYEGLPQEELTEEDVPLDSSLQVQEEAAGEHMTPQDAVAPVAAEILQKILIGMRMRGRITRREAADEGEAAFQDDQDSVVLNVTGLNERDQGMLIGRRGETLDALQFLLNIILGRKVDLWARVIVDVEGYRLRRKLALISLARRTAEQVQQRKQAIPLEAMSAHERRIIHMTLSDHPEVVTESTGAEPERRIVVMPR
ncbi:MAG TPA: R3H domain-containing nucleic acid-binding protein [Chloroflexia bacterium]|nr:R3H domain-containing nucleic acid-binding protein [Chloroflexia bacterium]